MCLLVCMIWKNKVASSHYFFNHNSQNPVASIQVVVQESNIFPSLNNRAMGGWLQQPRCPCLSSHPLHHGGSCYLHMLVYLQATVNFSRELPTVRKPSLYSWSHAKPGNWRVQQNMCWLLNWWQTATEIYVVGFIPGGGISTRILANVFSPVQGIENPWTSSLTLFGDVLCPYIQILIGRVMCLFGPVEMKIFVRYLCTSALTMPRCPALSTSVKMGAVTAISCPIYFTSLRGGGFQLFLYDCFCSNGICSFLPAHSSFPSA